jgi:hypothetical protein
VNHQVVNMEEQLFKPSARSIVASLAIAGSAALIGCEVQVYNPQPPPPPPPPPPAAVVTVGPVIDDPSVVAIDVEPPPDQRLYVYDPGYPPGCYYYGGWYYYGGYRYPHDVFINRYVTVNVRERRFIDVQENRRQVDVIRVQQRNTYNRYGGHPQHPAPAPAPHHEEHPQPHY